MIPKTWDLDISPGYRPHTIPSRTLLLDLKTSNTNSLDCGLLYGEKNYDNMSSRFHIIPERKRQTDGRTDRQNNAISIYQ